MKKNRRQELSDYFEREIMRQNESGMECDILIWICQHLRIYLNRVIGFATRGSVSMKEVVESTFFDMVQISSDRMETELLKRQAPRRVMIAWIDYASALQAVGCESNADSFSQLSALLSEVEIFLSAK